MIVNGEVYKDEVWCDKYLALKKASEYAKSYKKFLEDKEYKIMVDVIGGEGSVDNATPAVINVDGENRYFNSIKNAMKVLRKSHKNIKSKNILEDAIRFAGRRGKV